MTHRCPRHCPGVIGDGSRISYTAGAEQFSGAENPLPSLISHFAWSRTDSVTVSMLLRSGGTLAARVVVLHEPHSGRHDRETVKLGSKKAAKIGTIEGQQNIGRRQGTE